MYQSTFILSAHLSTFCSLIDRTRVTQFLKISQLLSTVLKTALSIVLVNIASMLSYHVKIFALHIPLDIFIWGRQTSEIKHKTHKHQTLTWFLTFRYLFLVPDCVTSDAIVVIRYIFRWKISACVLWGMLFF